MASTLLTPTIIAREALMQLENNLVMGQLVHRAYEDEFGAANSNGNKIGSTITIRRPVRYTVRSGAVAQAQDTAEGSVQITVNKQKGVDLQFSSTDLTLTIADFSKRYVQPAMSQLANQVDQDLYGLFSSVSNWVGTPGQQLTTLAGFFKGPQRMDELAIPDTSRRAVLVPNDYWGMLGSLTGLYAKQGQTAETALRRAELGNIGNVDIYQAQNVTTLTTGTRTNSTPLVNGNNQNVAYTGNALTATPQSQTLILNGFAGSATIAAGDVFTIGSVFAVNPVSKVAYSYLKQFTVLNAATCDGSGNVTLTISPAIITTGPYQTVSAAPVSGAAITFNGSASTGYVQNMVFHENAFALCMVPMELPEGAVRAARETYKGLSVRVVPYYDGTNDISNWRFDILYGVAAIYPELATRISGT